MQSHVQSLAYACRALRECTLSASCQLYRGSSQICVLAGAVLGRDRRRLASLRIKLEHILVRVPPFTRLWLTRVFNLDDAYVFLACRPVLPMNVVRSLFCERTNGARAGYSWTICAAHGKQVGLDGLWDSVSVVHKKQVG
jgi:hypothetical protein